MEARSERKEHRLTLLLSRPESSSSTPLGENRTETSRDMRAGNPGEHTLSLAYSFIRPVRHPVLRFRRELRRELIGHPLFSLSKDHPTRSLSLSLKVHTNAFVSTELCLVIDTITVTRDECPRTNALRESSRIFSSPVKAAFTCRKCQSY